MKYIRTKDERIGTGWEIASKPNMISFGQPHKFRQEISKDSVLVQTDTIEELCDEFVYHLKSGGKFIDEELANKFDVYEKVYGAIWTDKGLIYVAKMNEKGELELL